MAEQQRSDRIPDGVFFAGACVLFLAIALAMAALAGAFSGSVWPVGDTKIFFEMADVIVHGGTPYVDFQDPKPPLIYFLLAVPEALGAGMAGGLLLVAIANAASAAVLIAVGWRLYGRGAGLLAGLLFVVNMAWAQGYFVLTEPFSILFVLLSVWLLTCGGRHRYLLAGVSAGMAVGFKQYALLLLPLAMFYAYRKGEAKEIVPWLAGVLLPLAVMFGAVFLAYGVAAGDAALYWSFGMAPAYFTETSIGAVPAYQVGDPVIAAAWVGLALSLFAPLLLLAAGGFVARKRRAEEELFALAALAFAATLVIRPFLHYWTFLLPFAALLAAGVIGPPREHVRLRRPSGAAGFALLAGAVYAVLLAAAAFITYVIVADIWRPHGIDEFYGLADIILKDTARYFGHVPEPAALSIGTGLASGIVILAAFCLATAMIVTAIAWRGYGQGPALMAGILLTAGTAFAPGYMLPSDGLAMLLVALAVYCLLFVFRGGSPAAGLLLGVAIVIKPYAIVLAPLALLFLLRSGRQRDATGFVLCVLAPVFLFGLAVSGGIAWGVSWGPAPGGVAAAYDVPDVLMAMMNLAAAGSFVTVTLVAAVAAFLSRKAGPAEEFLLLSALALLYTLAFQAFVHYWFIALPFAAVLCARLFSGQQKVIMKSGSNQT